MNQPPEPKAAERREDSVATSLARLRELEDERLAAEAAEDEARRARAREEQAARERAEAEAREAEQRAREAAEAEERSLAAAEARIKDLERRLTDANMNITVLRATREHGGDQPAAGTTRPASRGHIAAAVVVTALVVGALGAVLVHKQRTVRLQAESALAERAQEARHLTAELRTSEARRAELEARLAHAESELARLRQATRAAPPPPEQATAHRPTVRRAPTPAPVAPQTPAHLRRGDIRVSVDDDPISGIEFPSASGKKR